MDNSNPQNQTPAQDLPLSYSSVLSQFSTPLTNLTPWLLESSTPLLSGSSEASLTNSTPSFDATVYPQSSQTFFTQISQSSQSSIAYNADGIMQEEHHEPNQPVEDHAVTPSPNLDISNAVGLTSATVPTSSQKQPVDSFEERVYNVVKTTPPAKKSKPDLKTDEAKEWLKSFIVATTSRYKKNVSAPKKTQINFFRSLVAYLFLFVGVAGLLDKEISNITVHELAQAVVHMKDYPDDEDIPLSIEPNESKYLCIT